MQNLIDAIIANPLLLTLGVILVIVLLYAVFKRIIKLLLIIFFAIILFLVYAHYTGTSIKDNVQQIVK